MRRFRAFFVVLVATSLVWLGLSLSDRSNHPIMVSVKVTGYDAARYAVVDVDDSLLLNIESSGFSAISRWLHRNRHLTVDMSHLKGSYRAVAVSDCLRLFSSQLSLDGRDKISCAKDSVRLYLSERKRLPLVPSLRNLEIEFGGHYGLDGVPRFNPDTVWLYGDSVSLLKIKTLDVEPVRIAELDTTSVYKLKLNPVWEQFRDVYPSHKEVEVTIPVASYAEKKFTLPIHFLGADSSLTVRLYPDTVALTAWVREDKFISLSADHFKASTSYVEGAQRLPVTISSFPGYVRIKSVVPSEIQYVIIK